MRRAESNSPSRDLKGGKTCSRVLQQLQRGDSSPQEDRQLEGRIVVQPHCSPSLMKPR